MIRRATREDAAAVAGVSHRGWHRAYGSFIESLLLPPAPATAAWAERIASDHYTTIVFDDGEIRGFASFGPTEAEDREPPGTGILMALYVDDEGRGIGSALLEAACQAMRGAGMHQAILWTFAENAPARAFYERRGWTPEPASEQPHDRTGAIELRYRRVL